MKYEYKSIEINEILVSARAGANLWDCKKEAVILSLIENVSVKLNHNDIIYLSDPDTIKVSCCHLK